MRYDKIAKLSFFSRDYVAPLINQTGMSGAIQSPDFPNFYPKYGWQDYYIEVPSSEYQV